MALMGAPVVLSAAGAPSSSGAAPVEAKAHSGSAAPRPAAADSAADLDRPAPLIVPGRPAPGETGFDRAKFARERYQLGLTFEKKGIVTAAIASYGVAVEADPEIPDAHYRMGKLYLTQNEVKEAARHFAAEVHYHPENLLADRELGLTLAQLGDTARAIERLDRLTRLRPLDGDNWRALGFAYSTAGRTAQAEVALRRAIGLPPKRASEHRDLAVLLVSSGREKEAREEYRKALAVDPSDASVWYNLGNLERRQGRLEPALHAYREAEKHDSTFSFAIQGQIAVLNQLDRPAETGDTYRRWLKVKPDDHNARLEAVRHFNAAGRSDIALQLARDGVRQDPGSPDARIVLAIAYEYAGQMRSSLEELRTAQRQYAVPQGRARVEALVSQLRAAAPDSLRALFAADSVKHARPDTTAAGAVPSGRKPKP